MKVSRKLFVLTPLCALMAAGSAYATDGYFPIGYGMKAKGMGGTSLTQTNNAFAGANNPAIAAFAGNRVDAGLDVFMPDRGMSRTGSHVWPGCQCRERPRLVLDSGVRLQRRWSTTRLARASRCTAMAA
jgi:hypothetical protein